MCGFVGFIGEPGAFDADALERLAVRMAARLESRGPDDAGTWVSPSTGIALGHRRLAIIELSTAGHQPMISASGHLVIAYNDEVYNFADLRRDLEAENRRFRGGSDTEVVLEACEAWGVERAVSKFIGMFAFAFWDVHARRLTLVRDRLGIKPLYWGRSGGVLFFGSQPKAFADHPAWRPVVDRDALAAYLRHAYVPAPHSIFQGIEKLESGCMVEIDVHGAEKRHRYWDLRSLARDAVRGRDALDDGAAVESLDTLLRDAVKRRMVADVPLGVFLSGGIDSSTVLALMQAESERPVQSFTIGFAEAGYDEAGDAKRVAAHLGSDHTELCVTEDHALAVLPWLADWYDEPFADSSQVPTYLVSEMTRRDVTVALSGDGGDEAFAGYNRHVRAAAGPASRRDRLAEEGHRLAAGGARPVGGQAQQPDCVAAQAARPSARGGRAVGGGPGSHHRVAARAQRPAAGGDRTGHGHDRVAAREERPAARRGASFGGCCHGNWLVSAAGGE